MPITHTFVSAKVDGPDATLVQPTDWNANHTGSSSVAVLAKTGAYTVVAADAGKLINATSGTWTLTLLAAATAADGFWIEVRNSGTGVITIDADAAETIDGATTVVLDARYDSVLLVCDGTGWHRQSSFAVDQQRVPVLAKTGAYTLTVADRGRLIDATSGTWSLTLPTAASAGDGFWFAVKAGSGAITIDPNGAELINGAATLELATGNEAIVVCSGTAWRTISRYATGLALAGSNTTEQTTTATTVVSIVTMAVTSIAAGTPILIVINWRKSAGAAAAVSIGLTLNTDEVNSGQTASTSTNQAESGTAVFVLGAREASYLRAMSGLGVTAAGALNTWRALADTPTAAITTVIIRGYTDSASVTLAIKDVRVYTLPTS